MTLRPLAAALLAAAALGLAACGADDETPAAGAPRPTTTRCARRR